MYIPNDTTSASLVVGASSPARNRYHIVASTRGEAADRRKADQDLRNALAHDQLLLHYQPRYSLATGQAIGAEALVRWPHRKRGLLPPAGFLPNAARSNLITRIGGWVLRTACSEAAGWQDKGVISVNVAAKQLAEGTLLEQVSEALDLSGLAPERLELELNEAMLLDVDVEVMLMLAAIRDLGVGLALDDFGTGHASLTVLRRVPLSVLKLDRSIVRNLPHFANEAGVVRGILDIGHALDMTIAAEGIETESQRDFLTDSGCDQGQGFLLCRPLSTDELHQQHDRAALANNTGASRQALGLPTEGLQEAA